MFVSLDSLGFLANIFKAILDILIILSFSI